MSDIDLSGAIEAAARALTHHFGRSVRYGSDDREANAAVRAAAPLIEAAVREQIARDIESLTEALGMGEDYGARAYNHGLDDAAHIARGAS